MSKVINIEEHMPHITQELICIRCKRRFWNVRPDNGALLKDLECPYCKRTGFIIATGQEIME